MKAQLRPNRPPPSRRVLCVALAAGLASGALSAQDDPFSLEDEPVAEQQKPEQLEAERKELTETRNWVEIGAGWVSDDAFRFGRYNGLERQGGYGVLNFEVGQRGAWDGNDAGYWRFTGSDLGLDTREIRFDGGVQGAWRVRVGYDELPTRRGDSAQTIFTNPGSNTLTLPSGWVPGQNTATMTQLTGSLRDVDIEHLRRIFDLAFDRTLRQTWEFSTAYRHETKDGNKTLGGVIGNSGGNPRAVLLPEPVDYRTDQIDAVLRWGDKRRQFQAGYYVSLFYNDNDALTWQNPYAAITGWNTAAGFTNGQGSLALSPDNQFHQLSVAGGWNVSDRTRLTGDAAIGRMLQNERFLPYTINPALDASITQPLPRDSLDGRIDTTVVNLRLSSRPTTRWFWNAGLRYDDRDNQTPRDEYVYIGGDSQTQQTGATSSFRRYNEPYSYREEKWRVDSGYQLADRLDLNASAEHRGIERTYSEREEADENTFTLGLRSDFSDHIAGGLRLTRADRSGSTYIGNEPFLSGYAPGYTGTVPGSFENLPLLRKFHLADRERDQATLYLSLTPHEAWSIGLNANYLEDDYDRSELGLVHSRMHDYTVDLAWVPAATWSAYGFYTYEKLASDQDGQSVRGATRLIDAADPARSWFADHRDRVSTWGTGLTHEAIEDRLDIGADYVRSHSTSDVFVSTGTALTARALPQDTTRLQALTLYARYQWRKDVAVTFGYHLEDYESTDWAIDGIEANQLANIILLGEDSPDYRVNVVSVSFAFSF